MGKGQRAWGLHDTWEMQDCVKAGKSWQESLRYFPGRSPSSVEAKWYSVKHKLEVAAEREKAGLPPVECVEVEADEPATGRARTAVQQDNAFQDAMTRAHAERRRQASAAAAPERKRA